MLNRRNLRIKAMQTLFAFQQIRASNQQIAWENLSTAIISDGENWSEKGTSLEKLFKSHLQDPEKITLEEIPSELREELDKQARGYIQQTSEDLKYLRSQMLLEVEGLHQLFQQILGLFPALAELEQHLLQRKTLSSENQKSLLKNLGSINLLKQTIGTKKFPLWQDKQDRLSQWYKEIKAHAEKDEELNKIAKDLDEDVARLKYLFKSVLWKSESFQTFFEEHDRCWIENKDIIKSMINKTLKSITEEGAQLAPLSYQWEEDKQFFQDIFDATLEHERWAQGLIADRAKNWDMDRIAQVDMILLKMALCEMRNFPSIPVKVTINEYIEMSKKYSTPKSKKFINGILDVLANDLLATGIIKKSGRGLIDNK